MLCVYVISAEHISQAELPLRKWRKNGAVIRASGQRVCRDSLVPVGPVPSQALTLGPGHPPEAPSIPSASGEGVVADPRGQPALLQAWYLPLGDQHRHLVMDGAPGDGQSPALLSAHLCWRKRSEEAQHRHWRLMGSAPHSRRAQVHLSHEHLLMLSHQLQCQTPA